MRLHLKSFELIVIGYQGYKSSFFPFIAYFDSVDCVCHFFLKFICFVVCKICKIAEKVSQNRGRMVKTQNNCSKTSSSQQKNYIISVLKEGFFFHTFRGFRAPYKRKNCFWSGLFKKNSEISNNLFFQGASSNLIWQNTHLYRKWF